MSNALDTAPVYRLVLRYVGERIERGDLTRQSADGTRHALLTFAASFGARPVAQLGPKAVDRWLATMTGMADSTRRNRVSQLKGFARWCVMHRIVDRDFTLALPKIRVARRVPRDLTVEHFGLILDVCHDDRDRLIVWLAFGCGLRCVEIHRLDVRDYDPMNRLLHVTGKAGHERVVPVPEPVRGAIDRYMAADPFGTGHLIRSTTRPGAPLSPSRISHIIGGLIREAGVKVRQYDGRSAHGLRAAAASDLYDVCKDPRIVQQFLGHQHLQTTTIYLRRAGVEQVRDAQDRRTFRPARVEVVT